MRDTAIYTTLLQEKPKYIPIAPQVVYYDEPIGSSHLSVQTEEFAPISLEEMESAALLNRTDTKYVLSIAQLYTILPELVPDYRILVVEGRRLNRYRTLYYDTPGFELFNLHVNGQAERFKVRQREYLDSNIAFLEVKHKTRKNRTIKSRINTQKLVDKNQKKTGKWLKNHVPFNTQMLESKIWNTFVRITLVSKHQPERVTIDTNLSFFSPHKKTRLSNVVVAEVKLDSQAQQSTFIELMRSSKIQPRGFSKYCVGISMLYDHVKKNRMKSKLMWIEKLEKGAVCNGQPC